MQRGRFGSVFEAWQGNERDRVAQVGPEPREGRSIRNSIDKLLAGFSEQQDNIIEN